MIYAVCFHSFAFAHFPLTIQPFLFYLIYVIYRILYRRPFRDTFQPSSNPPSPRPFISPPLCNITLVSLLQRLCAHRSGTRDLRLGDSATRMTSVFFPIHSPSRENDGNKLLVHLSARNLYTRLMIPPYPPLACLQRSSSSHPPYLPHTPVLPTFLPPFPRSTHRSGRLFAMLARADNDLFAIR